MADLASFFALISVQKGGRLNLWRKVSSNSTSGYKFAFLPRVDLVAGGSCRTSGTGLAKFKV
jgi:hypothetical protein